MKKYQRGYTQGVFDMFHIGHLNLINQAKKHCDYLIVGVNSDSLVEKYKKKTPVISEVDRAEIIRNIRAVDDVIIADTLDKEDILKRIDYDAIFIGDDWKGAPRWVETEEKLKKYNIDVVYLSHTDGISSTILRLENENKISE